MLDHYIQRNIVYRLAFTDKLRFSELKPDLLDNKLFNYHLKKVVSAGLVEKTDEGLYALTPEGRRLGVHVLDNQLASVDKADSVLFLVVRRKLDDAWLLYKRKTHPLINKVGFMHCSPNATENATQTARQCIADIGLNGSFIFLGSGFFRVFQNGKLESFTNFTLLVCEDAQGNLASKDEYADYYWQVQPDFTAPEMLPNMSLLSEYYARGERFYVEHTFEV